jgi:hypothetical protein
LWRWKSGAAACASGGAGKGRLPTAAWWRRAGGAQGFAGSRDADWRVLSVNPALSGGKIIKTVEKPSFAALAGGRGHGTGWYLAWQKTSSIIRGCTTTSTIRT